MLRKRYNGVVDGGGVAVMAQSPGWRRQAVVVAFLVGIGLLCTKSLCDGDARFGWGMFGANLAYTIHYEWVLEDGLRAPYQPGGELVGRARELAPREREPWRPRSMLYGEGALRRWVTSYQSYLFQNERPANAVAIDARLRLAVNPHEGAIAPASLYTMRYPAAGGPVR